MNPTNTATDGLRYGCIIKRAAHYGVYVEIPDLGASGLLRITEMTDPSVLQQDQAALLGTTIWARVIGRETSDGPLILTQR